MSGFSPARGLACVGGLAAVAAISLAMGSLTAGGKLFTGLSLVVWYMGLSNLSAADFTSALSAKPEPLFTLIYIGVALALLGAAMGEERFRAGHA
jgi:hypothetical protein